MKTIILCGGEGTRMKEETEFRPKPMVLVGGKPIIWHIMKIYAHYGFNDFVLALGYKSDYIKQFFLNQKALTTDFSLNTKTHKPKYHLENRTDIDDFNITFVETGLKSLPGERILRCQKYIPAKDENFMVTYGDGVSNIDIKKLVAFHKKKKLIGTLSGVHPRSKFGLLNVDDNSNITSFVEKPVLSDWVNGGFMVFKRNFFKYLNPGEMEHDGLKRLAAKNQLSLYPHDGFWQAVDTYKELQDLNELWNNTQPPWKVWA